MSFTANQCEQLPLNAKFEKVGSEKRSWQHISETNQHQYRVMIWLSNLAAQIESQKLTNQIKSQ